MPKGREPAMAQGEEAIWGCYVLGEVVNKVVIVIVKKVLICSDP